MKQYPLNSDVNGSTLEQKINEKIEELKEYEKEIPAVIIIHKISDFSVVYMSQNGLEHLEVTLDEIQKLGKEYHSRFFNPEDAEDYVPKIFGLLERNNTNELVTFFQQVRPSPEHDWIWYSSSTKVFLRDEEGNPVLTITIAIPIDPKHYFTAKVEKLLQENNFLRSNKHIFAALTKREKEILRLMALGHNSTGIGELLHISQTTAATHRRNIRSKLNAQTNYDITRFAQAFDLI
jgi:DNA-binding CsgD family transcriptional regulator